jgi:hypothetical protein
MRAVTGKNRFRSTSQQHHTGGISKGALIPVFCETSTNLSLELTSHQGGHEQKVCLCHTCTSAPVFVNSFNQTT